MRHAIPILTTVVALALGAAPPAHAQSGPFEVLGDNASNAIAINATSAGTIQLCVDGFCSEEAADSFDTIVVSGFDGDDTLTVDQDSFLTNGRGGIDVSFNGGPGNDRLEVCPDAGCSAAGVEATTFTPGAGPGQGTISQTRGGDQLDIAFDSVVDAVDLSSGPLTVQGTPADDVVTYGPGAGGDLARGRVSVAGLVPYEFSNKSSLTVNGNAGGDRLELDRSGRPTGLAGDCGGGYALCFEGGSSSGDSLVMTGSPAVHEQPLLVPLGRGVFGEELGALEGIASPLRYGGIESLDVLLQFGADLDRFAVAGTPGRDRFALSTAHAAREVAIAASLDLDSPGAQALPAVTVRAANTNDVADIAIDAGDGSDDVSYDGTARDDALRIAPAGVRDELQHAIDGQLAYRLGLTGVEQRLPAGGDGDDALTVRGDLAGATHWAGGGGSDLAALDGTGLGQAALSFATGELHQQGFGTVHTSGTERFHVGAGGSSLRIDGTPAGDTLRYTPSAADAGAVALDGDDRTATVAGAGELDLDPLDGQDTVFVNGTAAADQIALTREDAGGTLLAQVGSTLRARVAASGEAVRAAGAAGEDRFVVAGSGGPASVTVDGGSDPGADALVMTQDVHDAAVRFATDPSAGVVETGAPPVGFLALERVELGGDDGGTLSISGSGAPDALTQTGNLVTAGAGAAVAFSRFPVLALDGRAGSDQVTLDPRGTSGVDRIDVAGGESSSDSLAVNGTELGEQLRHAPTAPAAGQVAVAAAPPVEYTDVESLALDGRTGGLAGDTLVIDTRALDGTQVLEPGASFDAGSVQFRDAGGATTTAAPLTFTRLGAGSLSFDDDARDDRLVYRGSPAGDAFTLTTAGVVRLGAQVPVHTPGIRTLVLDAQDGEDTFDIAADHPFPGASGPGVVADGGGPDAGDAVTVAGAGIPSTVDLGQGTVAATGFAPVALAGIARLDVDAAGALAVRGSDGPDAIRYTPTGAQSGTLTRDGGAPELRFTNLPGRLSADAGAGADEVVVSGRSTPDAALIARGDPTTVQVASLKTLQIPAATEALRLLGLDGADRTTVTGAGGPAALTVAGGSPTADGDSLVLDSSSAHVSYDVAPSSGLLESPGGAISFLETELVDLRGDDAGSLTVRGTTGIDSIAAGHATSPQVTVNGGAAVRYAGYPTLNLDGRGGDDALAVSYANLGDVSAVHVAGGGGLSDALAVEDQPGAKRTLDVRPTAPDAGRFSLGMPATALDFESTESLRVDGAGGDDELRLITPSGGQQVRVTPGAADDAAALQVGTLVPVRFQRLGAGRLRIADADGVRADAVTYDGLHAADVFRATADPSSVTLNGRIPLVPDAAARLVLNGLDGDDTFNLAADHSFPGPDGPGIVADGGNPDDGDVVNVAGAGIPSTVDFGQGTVTADGFAPVALRDIARLDLDAATELAVRGSDGPDVIRYTPTGSQAGRFSRDGAAPELRFTNLPGELSADAGGDADEIVVNGRSTADETLIERGDPTTVRIASLKTLQIPAATEALRLLAGDGADTTTVTGAGGPANLTVAGGLPSAVGDRLVFAGANAEIAYDMPPSSGLLTSPGGAIGFLEMELVDLRGDGAGSLTVRGTNANDVITAGHGTPPQVTVNDGPAMHFAGYPTLNLDGRAGSDVFDISYANLGDVSALHVIGGPGLGDELVVEDRPVAERTLEVHPTAADAGRFSLGAPDALLDFESTESLVVDGMGGADELRLVTPSGAQQVGLTPGATDDAASLQLAGLVPVRFQRLGAGRLRVADAGGGRADTLTYDGLAGADVFKVIGDPNSVTLNSRIPLLPDAATHLVLNGFDGDDRFDITGPVPFATTKTDGSGPDRADSVAVTGPSGPVTADIGAGTLTGYGGTIAFPGIEQIATDAGGEQLTQVGRAEDDALCYDPMSPRSGRAYVVGAPGGGSVATVCSPDQRGTNLLHTFTDVARLLFDPAGGSDQVIVNGTTTADLVTLQLTSPTAAVTVHPDASDPHAFRLPAEVHVASTESLAVAADNGVDVFDVTVFNNPAPTVFLDGEDPAPKRFGDELRVRNGAADRVGYHTVTGHEFGDGSVFAEYRNLFGQRIDYTRIEEVRTYR